MQKFSLAIDAEAQQRLFQNSETLAGDNQAEKIGLLPGLLDLEASGIENKMQQTQITNQKEAVSRLIWEILEREKASSIIVGNYHVVTSNEWICIIQGRKILRAVQKTQAEHGVLDTLIKNNNVLECKPEQRAAAMKLAEKLNEDFKGSGIYFSIDNDIFSCKPGDTNSIEFKEGKEIIFNASLKFQNGDEIDVKVSAPVRKNGTWNFTFFVADKSIEMTYITAAAFIELLSEPGRAVELKHDQSKRLHPKLRIVGMELIGKGYGRNNSHV